MRAGGFYVMQRGWMESPIFSRETVNRHGAWAWLNEHAAYRPMQVRIGAVIYAVPRGSLASSLRGLARAWGWQVGSVRRFLAALEREGMIRTHVEDQMTILAISGYGGAEGSELPIADDASEVINQPADAKLVYVICVKTRTGRLSAPVKIGISAAPDERLRDLQSANPETLVCVETWPAGHNSRAIERAVHQHFARYRMSGEWFDIEPHVVRGVISTHYERSKEQTQPPSKNRTATGTANAAGNMGYPALVGTPPNDEPARCFRLPGTHKEKQESEGIEEKREAKASPKKGTRWAGVVCEEWIAEADSIRFNAHLPAINAGMEADKFADHWIGKSGQAGVKLDWHATWRNWVRNARGGMQVNGKRSAVEKLYAGAAAAAEEWERREADSGAGLAPVIPLLDRGRPRGIA